MLVADWNCEVTGFSDSFIAPSADWVWWDGAELLKIVCALGPVSGSTAPVIARRQCQVDSKVGSRMKLTSSYFRASQRPHASSHLAHIGATVVKKGSRIRIMQVLFVLAFPTYSSLELGMCNGD